MAEAEQDGLVIDGGAERTAPRMPSERSFAWVVAGVLLLITFWPLLHAESPRWALLLPAGAVVGLAVRRPDMLRPWNCAWFRLGLLLHRLVSPLVFGLLFFCVVTPTALILRARGQRPLTLRPDPAADSYWIARPPGPPPAETMTRQF